MRIAFVVDPLEHLDPLEDSSIALMRAAVARGHGVAAILRRELSWRDGQVLAEAVWLKPEPASNSGGSPWWQEIGRMTVPLQRFDAVLMRQDPPFDTEYLAATWLLELAQQAGCRVFTDPRALRDHSEKLAIAEFPQFLAPTCVSRHEEVLLDFVLEHGKAVLKPLDLMAGRGVVCVEATDPDLRQHIRAACVDGQRSLMAQRYLPAVMQGDVRVLTIAGQVVPWAWCRVPDPAAKGEPGAQQVGHARLLTARERQIAEHLAPILWRRGILLAGLDVIGGCLTEINITSPTHLACLARETPCDPPAMLIEALENCCQVGRAVARVAG